MPEGVGWRVEVWLWKRGGARFKPIKHLEDTQLENNSKYLVEILKPNEGWPNGIVWYQ